MEERDRCEFRMLATLIAFFNTLDADESIREADLLIAKFFGDPVGADRTGWDETRRPLDF